MLRKLSLVLLLFVSLAPACPAAEVKGRAVFEGAAPARAALDTGSDPFCGARHPDGLMSEEAIVSSSGGLKNVFVYVKKGVSGTFEAPKEPAVLDQDGCRYEPRVFGLRAGQPLEMRNSDDTLHNVHTACAANKSFNVGMPVQNMKILKTFDKPEVMVSFQCDVHPWMAAYAGVLDHPFFAVSGDDGSFVIRDLPPGTYEIEAWHEKLGAREAKLVLAPGDTEINVDFSFSS